MNRLRSWGPIPRVLAAIIVGSVYALAVLTLYRSGYVWTAAALFLCGWTVYLLGVMHGEEHHR